MADEKADAVEVSIRINAAPSDVYRFLTDPQKLRNWLADVVEADPQPGGVLRLSGASGLVMRGEFVEVVPNRRVVFTWGWESGPPVPPGSSRVEIDLEAEGDGTRLRLRHGDLATDQVEEHAGGWERALPKLKAAAEGRDPGGTCLGAARC